MESGFACLSGLELTDNSVERVKRRISHEISIKVSQKERDFPLYLAHAGDSWLQEGKDIHLLLDNQDYIDFQVHTLSGSARGKQYRMSLQDFPKRDRRCTKVSLHTRFLGNGTAVIKLTDLGFGELWKGTYQSIEETIPLGKE